MSQDSSTSNLLVWSKLIHRITKEGAVLGIYPRDRVHDKPFMPEKGPEWDIDARLLTGSGIIEIAYNPTTAFDLNKFIPIISHELGHHIDFQENGELELGDTDRLKMQKHFYLLMSDKGKRSMLDNEARAWNNAEKILVELEYQDWDTFAFIKAEAMGTYEENIKMEQEETKQAYEECQKRWVVEVAEMFFNKISKRDS